MEENKKKTPVSCAKLFWINLVLSACTFGADL